MSSKFSHEEYVHLGKQAYRDRRYEAALAHFQNAMRLLRKPDMDILDSLAATSEKLGNLDLALKYGKQMIQSESSIARGYLRVGRTLQSKSDSKLKELTIYDRGLSRTSPSDSQYKLLMSVRNRLHRELNPPETFDPITVLPAELVYMIFGYIEFNKIVQCLRVSKGWHKYLTSQPWFWQHIDISTGSLSAQKRLPAKSLLQWAKWSQYNIKSANLGAFSHRQSVVVLSIKCKSLSSLTFSADSTIDAEVVKTVLKYAKSLKSLACMQTLHSYSELQEGMQSAHNLVHVEFACGRLSFGHLNNPETLRLYTLKHFSLKLSESSPNVNASNMQSLLATMPNLQSLMLSTMSINELLDVNNGLFFDRLTKLEHLHLQNVILGNILLPSSLESLTLDHVRPVLPMFGMPGEAWYPSLKNVKLTKCFDILEILSYLLATPSAEQIALNPDLALKEFSQLEGLTLGALEWDNHPVMDALFQVNLRPIFKLPRVADIRSLSVDIPEFDDDTVTMIKEYQRKLKSIRLANSALTGVGVKSLVQSQPQLGWLILENCISVSSDAIVWAKAQGVHVVNNTKLNPRVNGGRSVRY